MTVKYILRLDDIAPKMAWSMFDRLEEKLNKLGIKPVVGVVPDNQDLALEVEDTNINFWDRVRSWSQLEWTIAQHGYQHEYATRDGGILGINKFSEFSGLDHKTQFNKLKLGKNILITNKVWQPVFMAPAHSFDNVTLQVLKELKFEYITDGYGLFPYKKAGLIFVPQLFSSFRNIGFGVYTVCIHLNVIDEKEMDSLLDFLEENKDKFISFQESMNYKHQYEFLDALTRFLFSKSLRFFRFLKNIKINI